MNEEFCYINNKRKTAEKNEKMMTLGGHNVTALHNVKSMLKQQTFFGLLYSVYYKNRAILFPYLLINFVKERCISSVIGI